MTIRANRYNDPSVGQAFESLAQLFAPVSGSDLAGYAAADLNRQKAAQEAQRLGLIDMFASGQGGDNAGIAAGLYTPAQSWGAVGLGDQTTRRGQDIDLQGTIYGADRDYAASTENNVRDNARAMDLGLLGDETTQRGQDIDLQGLVYGADRDYAASTENNVRDNETDLRTGAMGNLLKPLDPGQQTRAIPDEVWGAMGIPGMPSTEEYRNTTTSGSPNLTNARLPDGSQTVAIETPNGLVDPATGQPLPSGTTMFSTNAQGSADDVGLGRTTTGKVEQQMLELGTAVGTAKSLRQMIADNGASQGLVGAVRMTAQNLMQSGTELGDYLGGSVQEMSQLVEQGILDAGVASEFFDPSLPAIDMLGNMLAFQYAKSLTGERLSNEMLRTARSALGLDRALSNQADSLARLDMAIAQLQRQQEFLGGAMSTGQIGTSGALGVPGGGAPAPAAGGRVRYDTEGNRIE